MSIVLKAAAGLATGALVGALTVAFWPRLDLIEIGARPAVEQPKFANATAVPKAIALAKTPDSASSAIASADPTSGTDRIALEKLALAFRAPVEADASQIHPLVTRSLTSSEANTTESALRLRAQGLVALAGGDVATARAFLERAAEGGDARALLVLGDTYDPSTLTRMGAVDYYGRALSAGVAAARDRIALRDSQQN